MRAVYETATDRDNEQRIAQRFLRESGIRGYLSKLPVSYGVDYAVLRSDRSVAGWLEVKRRPGMEWGDYPDICVSLLKVRAARALVGMTGRWCLFCVEDAAGETRCCSLADVSPAWIRMGGRTTQTRDAADIEPCAYIPVEQFAPVTA